MELQREPESVAYKLSKHLLDALNERFYFVEDVKELALATFCDPRYKKKALRSLDKVNRALRWLKSEMHAVEEEQAAEQNVPPKPIPSLSSTSVL